MNIPDENPDLYKEEHGLFTPNQYDQEELDRANIYHKGGVKYNDDLADKELSDIDLVLIAAQVHSFWHNLASDETREELLRPFVNALTKDEVRNWLLVSNGILWRSRNEFKRIKTEDKSMIYLQGLID